MKYSIILISLLLSACVVEDYPSDHFRGTKHYDPDSRERHNREDNRRYDDSYGGYYDYHEYHGPRGYHCPPGQAKKGRC